ncbi:hypothetical protein I312_105803 [Cryptococcus bacillisporus CA1280]|uniref:Uncharacterized protein n=2 Tax=Cryptococcus gattii TaxID=552467 RepID=A0A0D0U7M2_CRYGA|nr:hypothetical protein I312_06583 [Cryptococcus bacillisporus CA1280]KIR58131.1 hypothetical protein I314_06096 [Cryptococcus bacillisporus CA1873]|eukprot:KIR58131.1 hypothetical protein I314_06096 [Cryptococcus gattii CA1873]
MPACRVTNNTAHPLNISLKQVTALHFENSVQPGQTIKFRPGKVWFTLEALVDDGSKKSRYSVLKSAATIAVISVAVGAVAATAGAALLPEAAAVETAAAAGVAGGVIAKGVTAAKTALIANSGTIARISSMALPKAIEKLSEETGGLTALQREVLSIIASPTLSSDVRHKSASLLRSLHKSYTDHKAASQEPSSSNTPDIDKPSATLTPISDDEAEKIEKDVESGEVDDRVENTAVRTGEVLRVHGIYMKNPRGFEIRVGEEGKLVLYDVDQKKFIM